MDGSANLFLINPNGILFGADARLDIAGSFVASTASHLSWENGAEFSATNPAAPPLLTVNLQPGLQYGHQTRAITNNGILYTGQDLTLAGHHLVLQGQLQAGGNLTLLATERVQVRDRVDQPFTATAGGMLLVQGNQAVDIFALHHPDSGFFVQKDLVLRSIDSILGDAYFFTQGNFRVEQWDGQPGRWQSPNDPVIRASGDVSFSDYIGASLHILAGGAVSADSITITGADTTTGLIETVTLSDGTTLVINGQTQPTLDIRAGTTAFGTPLGLTGTPSPTDLQTPASTNAGTITLGTIINDQPNSLTFISTRYLPSAGSGAVTVGDIISGGGAVVIDSRSGLIVDGIIDSSDFSGGNAGDVKLLAAGDLIINAGGSVQAIGELGGNITLQGGGLVSITGVGIPSLFIINSESLTFDPSLKGGDITITGRTIALNDAANILADTFDAIGGNVTLRATEAILFDGSEADTATFAFGQGGNLTVETPLLSLNNASGLLAVSLGNGAAGNITINAASISLNTADNVTRNTQVGSLAFADGDAGNLTMIGQSLAVTNGSQIVATTFGGGDAGQVSINIADSILLDGDNEGGGLGSIFSGILSTVVGTNATGAGGIVEITTGQLTITNGAQVRTSTEGAGDAGSISIKAETLFVSGISEFLSNEGQFLRSAITSDGLAGAEGNGGDITIAAQTATFREGGVISAATNSAVLTDPRGRAGNITLKIERSLVFDGVVNSFRSGISVEAFQQGVGGSIDISAGSLEVVNGAQLRSSTAGGGAAGDVAIKATDSVVLAGASSGLFASTRSDSTGAGGNITIRAPEVIVRDAALISTSSEGSGVGGDIQIEANHLTLNNRAGISAETQSNTGGNIGLQIQEVLLLRRGSFISATAGRAQGLGDGGNIEIAAEFIVAVDSENSDITANAFQGRGGRVDITAQGIFGIEFRPNLTPLSDITASSELGINGVVTIRTPDLDPSRGLVKLPITPVDASRQVAQSCSGNSLAATDRQNRFIVTGRGGVPAGPSDALSHEMIWDDLRSLPASTAIQPVPRTVDSSLETPIIEAQTWTRNAQGQIELIAQNSAPPQSFGLSSTCQQRPSI